MKTVKTALPRSAHTPHNRVLAAVLAAGLTTAAATTGCNGHSLVPCRPAATVTYLTGLGIYGQESYMWVALAKGFFADAGLDVQIQPGRGTVPNLQLLREGKADYAAVDSSGAQIEHATGRAWEIRLVAAIHQRTALCISTLDGRGIRTPKDLEGRKVGYVEGGVNHALFPAYAARAGSIRPRSNGCRWMGSSCPRSWPPDASTR